MQRSVSIAHAQRISGWIAMILLVLAGLSLIDGLVGQMMRGPNRVDALPGGTYAVSGPMPPRTERVEEFVVDGNTRDGQVALVPVDVYKGYWFGGGMWRGEVRIGEKPYHGTFHFAVHDAFGEKQNPSLIFEVVVWPDKASMQAASLSRVVRWTGYDPFMLSAVILPFGLVAGLINFLLGVLWSRRLKEEGCAEIYKLLPAQGGFEATVELKGKDGVKAGMHGMVMRPDGRRIGACEVRVCVPGNDCIVFIDDTVPVHLGYVICIDDGVHHP